MMSELVIANSITIKIKKSGRAKQMRIAVHRDGTVSATKPARIALRHLLSFLTHHASWIQEKLRHFASLPTPNTYQHSQVYEYEKVHLRKRAKELAEERLQYFNQFYKLEYNKISIRDQKTRWGSCSRSGNLNFNYRIALLPTHLADYIIVHELCHLSELNHSKNFWGLVARTIPNHKELRKKLNYSDTQTTYQQT